MLNPNSQNQLPQGPQTPATPQQSGPESPFQSGEQSTMAQCDERGKVWIAVNSNAEKKPTCGEVPAAFNCCISELIAKFPRSAGKISKYDSNTTNLGYVMYACEDAGNDSFRVHYVKKGETRNAIDYKYMSFTEKPSNGTATSTCPKRPVLADDLLAQIMRYQTPGSFVGSNDPMQNGGDLNGDGEFDNPDDQNVTYPVYSMKSSGVMTHRRGKVNVVADIEFKTDRTSFYLKQSGTRAVSGDYEDRVNKQIGSANGTNNGERMSQSDLLATESNNYNFVLTNFIVYSESLKNNKGEEFNFPETPLPGIITPGVATRYDVFYGFPKLEYSTRVTGKMDRTIKTVITREVNESDRVVIKIVHDIGDTNGSLWQVFPLPQSMEYTIDPKRKIITQIKSVKFYHDPEGSGLKRYSTTSTSKTCRIVTGSDEKKYDC